MALSPMMQQYLTLHDQYPDCLLLFRLGDFYELFFEDAKTASRVLELTLTGRDCGLEERAPMCGVPYHAVNTYVERLISKGYKVAICEQLEDPALAKGLVSRDVVRVITAGTVTDPEMLDERANNFLLCVCFQKKDTALAWADVSTGEFYVCEPSESALRSEISRISPQETITNDFTRLRNLTGSALTTSASAGGSDSDHVWHSDFKKEKTAGEKTTLPYFQFRTCESLLKDQFHVSSLIPLGLEDHKTAVCAAGALLHYLHETQKNALEHLRPPQMESSGTFMLLDPGTRRNLELVETLRSRSRKGSLLSLLDHTATAMGGRLLRSWMEQPLLDRNAIETRHEAVETLVNNPVLSSSIREELDGVYDMERLLSKVSYQSLNARDCLSLTASLGKVPAIKELLFSAFFADTAAVADSAADSAASGRLSVEISRIYDHLDPLQELTDLLTRAIHPEAPLVISEGGIIRDGYNQELDEYRQAQTSGKQWIMSLEQKEREETGIRNLRIQYNRVFGYYIEVTKSYISLVPERYTRRQTLASSERYTTPELAEMERKIIGAQEQSVRLELRLFNEVREQVASCLHRIQMTCMALKTLDVYQALARAATENRYVRPVMTDDGSLSILDGRHPVVEASLHDGAFIPNDTFLDQDDNRMMIITGPNMAGKSTYMRQVALICLMAQIGSFVPAREAHLPVCDRIFTRVGASDDLASGQSTFMVEMSETAHILRSATPASLIILDEIGRGTSTFDGLAIAWAVVEYIVDKDKIGAKTLFATHYHELSELEGHLDGVKNFCVSVKEHGEDVLFLRKIIRGGADKSFGIHVARLAGVPHPVIVRAHEIQARLEVSEINQNTIGQNILGAESETRPSEQVDLFDYQRTELIQELQQLDVLSLTPMDALNQLFLLREKARKL